MVDTASAHYEWIVLSNTTLGVLMATINSSILLIALPDIFKGVQIDPLAPENTSLLLWLIMGYLLGLNQVAGIAGSFVGLVLRGLLAPVKWHLVFLVSVPFGVFGTFWAYWKLRDTGIRQPGRLDWWGNLTFAVGLITVLAGICSTCDCSVFGRSLRGTWPACCPGWAVAV